MRIKMSAFTQITMDDDYIIRDNKPDVLRVIYTKGDVVLEDAKLGNETVWITGKLQFKTLYQSDDATFRIDSVMGDIPFQEKVILENVQDGAEVFVDVSVEDLSVGIINSRKLMVRAVLNISVKGLEETSESLMCPLGPEKNYQQKTKEIPVLGQVENKRDILRVQKELLLPNSKGNIGSLLFYQVDFRNQENTLEEGCIKLQMDAQVMALYRSESTGEYECYETIVPVGGEMDIPGIYGDEIFWAKVSPMEIVMEPREDYDGESRMFGLDMTLMANVQVYREELCEALLDAYSLEKELHIDRKPIMLQQLLMKNVSKVRVLEQMHLEPKEERILQICGFGGHIIVDHMQKMENGIQLDAVLTVDILYNTTDDEVGYAHTRCQIPLEQFVEIEGMSGDTDVWMDAQIEQLQVNLLDNTEYEVKAIVQLPLMVMQNQQMDTIVHIEEEPLDMDALMKQPGMIGYVRKEGEELWDIAKKYHTVPEEIIELGDKALVIKRIL